MNISSFFQNAQVLSHAAISATSEKVVNLMTFQQKKVIMVALAALAILATVYVVCRSTFGEKVTVEIKKAADVVQKQKQKNQTSKDFQNQKAIKASGEIQNSHQNREAKENKGIIPPAKFEIKGFQDNKPIISQADYLAYKHALDEIAESSPSDLLINQIQIINNMHDKLLKCEKEQSAGEYILAADLYNTRLKVMESWNAVFKSDVAKKDLLIQSPHVKDNVDLQKIDIKVPLLTDSQKARQRYVELLDKHPTLKRTGKINDHKQGTYEILYKPEEMDEVQELTYQSLYKATNSYEAATKGSMIGVVYEDRWALVIRDAVMSPHGKKHTYIRFIWKAQLNGIEAGAAILPIVKTDDGDKIALILTNRHATSWEFEIPRGGSRANETSAQSAKRELEEETGYQINQAVYLGKMAPDTGILASVIPIFRGDVINKGVAKQERTEAIKGTFLFSMADIEAAFKNKDKDGNCWLEVLVDGEKKQFPLRDPFLVYALFQNQLLSNP